MCGISASGRGDSIHSKWLAGKSGDVGFGGALKARGTKLTRVELEKVGFAHGNQNVFKNRGQGEPKLEFSIPGHFWSKPSQNAFGQIRLQNAFGRIRSRTLLVKYVDGTSPEMCAGVSRGGAPARAARTDRVRGALP